MGMLSSTRRQQAREDDKVDQDNDLRRFSDMVVMLVLGMAVTVVVAVAAVAVIPVVAVGVVAVVVFEAARQQQ